ncbi:MAG TPA: DUF302 domain-containing protein, partial [Polyangiaceae bacterium]|nr:DUF302 domain-containing protein [Polyangiaceae bacterium]
RVPAEGQREIWMQSTSGLTTIRSELGARETMDRLEELVRARGATVFARIDHAAGARAQGLQLRSTELLIFGDARVGTRLMQDAQTLGIDLPLRALVWEDESGGVWLAYDEPGWLAARHGSSEAVASVTRAMAAALAELSARATRPG